MVIILYELKMVKWQCQIVSDHQKKVGGEGRGAGNGFKISELQGYGTNLVGECLNETLPPLKLYFVQ